uniref:Nuclear anchorage protein 1 (inferred by orthology to a C. elegans protein) n=1 Tax=Strongyloides venezuelensis TaxID=75913 RepID=A0A0K0F4B1_STRVS
MDFLKYLKSTDSSSGKNHLLDERIAKQKKTYTKWVNNVLQDHGSHYRVEDLCNDLRSGVVLADIVHAFTGVKLKVSTPSSLDDKAVISSNLSLVLESMRDDGVDLVNNNIGDIYDGKPKIVLGMVWQIILHYDIRKSIQHHQDFLSYSDTDQSFSSYENGSVRSFKSSPTNKIKNVVMSPITSYKKKKNKKRRAIERGQCNKIILTWLEREICIPYGIKISNFSSDWKDGVAFMALVHKFCPSLVDMEIVKRSPSYDNISCAFRYASEYLGIKSILEVGDILCDIPEDSAITLYVSQFMKINTLAQEDENKGVRKVSTQQDLSLLDEAISNNPNGNAVVSEKVVIREESGEEETQTKQFVLAGGPLSTVSEESCEDLPLDCHYTMNACMRMKNVVYGDHDDNPVEFVSEPTDYFITFSEANDSVFERSNVSKCERTMEEEVALSIDNNNLPSPNDGIESYDRDLENIFSSVFGSSVTEDNGNTNNNCDVESATNYIKQLTSSLSIGMEIEDDSVVLTDSDTGNEGDIECCLDEISSSRNKSFFDDSQESSSTSGTIIKSGTSGNLDVVETVESLIDAVDALMEMGGQSESELSPISNESPVIVYETDYEDNYVEERFCFPGIEDVSSRDTLNNVDEVDGENTNDIKKGDSCEIPYSVEEEQNDKLNLMPLLVAPYEKVNGMMNDNEAGEYVEGYPASLKATILQDCVAGEGVDGCSLQTTSDITLDLNESSPLDISFLNVSAENYENVGNEDNSMDESLFKEVANIKEIVEDMASKVQSIPGDRSGQHYNFSDQINKVLSSLDFPEKTIEDQIKDIAEAVGTFTTIYTEGLEKIGGNSESEDSLNPVVSENIWNSTDSENSCSELADVSSTTSVQTLEVCPEYADGCMNNNDLDGSLLNKDTSLRMRFVKSSGEENPLCCSSDTLEGDCIDEASTLEVEEVLRAKFSYTFVMLLLLIIVLVGMTYLVYDCSTCSSGYGFTSSLSSLCCASLEMRIQGLEGRVPF